MRANSGGIVYNLPLRMSAAILIPARYDSTRFPGKPLAPLCGKPVIQHVYESCRRAILASETLVATDSDEILQAVQSFGGTAVMTARDHASGTDRIAEVAASMGCDIIVNVQADEPLIRPEMIDDVISLLSGSAAEMGTLAKKIDNPRDIIDPNVVKVVFDSGRRALYFSRSPIPFHRDTWRLRSFQGKDDSQREEAVIAIAGGDCYRHVGIYSYRRDALIRLAGMNPTKLEEAEKLEQLRALENGYTILVKETSHETIGVDTPEDLERVKQWLSSSL